VWWCVVRSGRRTPGPSCFRRSTLARHATAKRFIRRQFCEEACEKGPFRAPHAALPSAASVVALLAFCLASGAKGLNLRRQVKAASATSLVVACSPPRSRTPGMRAHSSASSQGAASRVPSPTGKPSQPRPPLRARRARGAARGYGIVSVVGSWSLAAVWVLLSSVFG
jgi:hypothetical protein